MKNKTVKMILAVAVLAICCGAYVGVKTYVAKQEEKQESDEENEVTTVFSASVDDIKSVCFMIDKKEVVFEKDSDSWVKQDEKEFPVNQTTMDNAVSSITSIDSERVLENVEDLSEYGLDEPSNTIEITIDTDEGEESTIIRVGDENESEGKYYVSKDDDRSTVYFVDSTCVEPFAKSLYDYAQMEDFPTISSTDKISKVSVSGDEISFYELIKDEDTGFWNISDGENQEKADTAKVSSLASSFSSLAYDTFVDYDCDDMSEYGLDKPYAVISVDYQEEEETETDESLDTDDSEEEEKEPVLIDKQLVITVGDEADSGDRYVVVNDSSQIYTISSDSLLTFLGKSNVDFWDMTVSYLSVNNLDSMEVDYNNEKYELNVSRETTENEDGEEETTTEYSLDGSELNETDFTTFYNKVINLAAQRRLTEEYTSTNDPDMTIELVSTDGDKTEIMYYSYDTNYYAAVVGEKVYLVNKMTVKEMFSAFEKVVGLSDDE